MTDVMDGPEVVEVDAKGNVIELEGFQNKVGKGRGRLSATDEFDEELLEKCRDVGILESAIKAGGDYRQLSKGKIFWLPLQELWEFEVADQTTEDDQEFFDWFESFIDARKLEKKSNRKKTRSWDDWKPSWDNAPKKMSNWWSGWGYNSYGSTGSELTKRLAIALKAVTTTVSVVNDTGKRYRVKLASDTPQDPVSYTNYNEQLIVVSPQALLDTAIDQDTGIEITTGYALHEASHVKYSESLMDALTKPTVLRPQSVASLLHNLLEDLRIEELTGRKFPGFADYFGTAIDYLWDATGKEHAPPTWGPELTDKVNAAIMMAKFHKQYEPIAMADPELAAQWPWWREWSEGYIEGKEPIRMGVIRALERFGEDPQTQQQMDDLSQQEQELEKQQATPLNDAQFKQLMDKLKELLDKGGVTIDPCPSPGGPDPMNDGRRPKEEITLTDEQATELDRLIGEEYQQFEAFYKMHDGSLGGISPVIEMSKPMENEYSKAMYSPPGGMAERLREVFFFRKKLAAETERLLKTGFIDEEELWRVGTGDTRVFERTVEPDESYTSVTMLVDTSGSMIGSGLEKAQELATVMMACLRTQRGVRTRVRAHTTGTIGDSYLDRSETCRMFRIWDPGDPDTRLGLLQGVDHGANFDGFAIDWCAKELNDTAQPNEEKLLIVLSDGLPNGNIRASGTTVHYGGKPAMDHMRQLGEYWSRQGVSIVQIAVDDDIRPEDQAQMFKWWVGYENDRKLLVDLTKILVKTFGGTE